MTIIFSHVSRDQKMATAIPALGAPARAGATPPTAPAWAIPLLALPAQNAALQAQITSLKAQVASIQAQSANSRICRINRRTDQNYVPRQKEVRICATNLNLDCRNRSFSWCCTSPGCTTCTSCSWNNAFTLQEVGFSLLQLLKHLQ
jgi:hypothetical protein